MTPRPNLALAVAAAAFALSGGVAAAHETSFATEISITGASGPPSDRVFYGKVQSDHGRCIANRKVKLVAEFGASAKEVVDIDRTSDNGVWATGGDLEGARGEKAKVVEQDLRDGAKHDHVCDGDSAGTDE